MHMYMQKHTLQDFYIYMRVIKFHDISVECRLKVLLLHAMGPDTLLT